GSPSNKSLKLARTDDMGGAEDIELNVPAEIQSFGVNVKQQPLIPLFDTMNQKIVRMRTDYASVEKNIHQLELKLEGHYKNLLKDVNIFDKLFVENQNYFKELSLHIAAGEQKLEEVHNTVLPELKREAEETGDQHK